MVYQATLNGSQQLAIANSGAQTQINLTMSSSGQQQSQSSSFTTGKWLTKPRLFVVKSGFMLQINGERQHYVLIQQQNISTVAPPAELDNYTELDLTEVEDSQTANSGSFSPMPPMQPMKMGNMSMDLNSMSMQMGDMSLNLNNSGKSPQTTATQFCAQCGTKAKSGDRFCRSCGQELNS